MRAEAAHFVPGTNDPNNNMMQQQQQQMFSNDNPYASQHNYQQQQFNGYQQHHHHQNHHHNQYNNNGGYNNNRGYNNNNNRGYNNNRNNNNNRNFHNNNNNNNNNFGGNTFNQHHQQPSFFSQQDPAIPIVAPTTAPIGPNSRQASHPPDNQSEASSSTAITPRPGSSAASTTAVVSSLVASNSGQFNTNGGGGMLSADGSPHGSNNGMIVDAGNGNDPNGANAIPSFEAYHGEVKSNIHFSLNHCLRTHGLHMALDPRSGYHMSGHHGSAKPKVCGMFARSGSCRNGETCPDFHVISEQISREEHRIRQWLSEKEAEFNAHPDASYRVFYADLKEVIPVPFNALEFTRGLFLEPSDREKKPLAQIEAPPGSENTGRQNKRNNNNNNNNNNNDASLNNALNAKNPGIAQQAPTACGLYSQHPTKCKWGRWCNQAHVNPHWIDNHRREFEEWSVTLYKRFDDMPPDNTFGVHDPLSRQVIIVPKSAVREFTRGLMQQLPAKSPSVCLLDQQARCTASGRCNQVHVYPDYLSRVRHDIAANPQSSPFLHQIQNNQQQQQGSEMASSMGSPNPSTTSLHGGGSALLEPSHRDSTQPFLMLGNVANMPGEEGAAASAGGLPMPKSNNNNNNTASPPGYSSSSGTTNSFTNSPAKNGGGGLSLPVPKSKNSTTSSSTQQQQQQQSPSAEASSNNSNLVKSPVRKPSSLALALSPPVSPSNSAMTGGSALPKSISERGGGNTESGGAASSSGAATGGGASPNSGTGAGSKFTTTNTFTSTSTTQPPPLSGYVRPPDSPMFSSYLPGQSGRNVSSGNQGGGRGDGSGGQNQHSGGHTPGAGVPINHVSKASPNKAPGFFNASFHGGLQGGNSLSDPDATAVRLSPPMGFQDPAGSRERSASRTNNPYALSKMTGQANNNSGANYNDPNSLIGGDPMMSGSNSAMMTPTSLGPRFPPMKMTPVHGPSDVNEQSGAQNVSGGQPGSGNKNAGSANDSRKATPHGGISTPLSLVPQTPPGANQQLPPAPSLPPSTTNNNNNNSNFSNTNMNHSLNQHPHHHQHTNSLRSGRHSGGHTPSMSFQPLPSPHLWSPEHSRLAGRVDLSLTGAGGGGSGGGVQGQYQRGAADPNRQSPYYYQQQQGGGGSGVYGQQQQQQQHPYSSHRSPYNSNRASPNTINNNNNNQQNSSSSNNNNQQQNGSNTFPSSRASPTHNNNNTNSSSQQQSNNNSGKKNQNSNEKDQQQQDSNNSTTNGDSSKEKNSAPPPARPF